MTFPKHYSLTIVSAMVTVACLQAETTRVYFGTDGDGGISTSTLDLSTGKLSEPVLAAATKGAGFLAIHPNRRFLYSTGSGSDGEGVNAFAIDTTTGKLTHLNHQSSGGAGPTHLVVDRAGKNVLVANYSGGSSACLPIKPDGSLQARSAFIQHQGASVNPRRQQGPHAHGIYADPANRFVLVPDLGLDKVMIFRLDADKGALSANAPGFAAVAPGAGPRHLAFSPSGKFVYVINEMLCTMTAFSYDEKAGSMSELQTLSTLPAGVSVAESYSTAEVFCHPNGKFLYGSNRGHDTIVVFSIDEASGRLSLVEHEPSLAKIPRGFGIDPSGRYLIAGGQNSNDAHVFRIDASTGKLEPTGSSVKLPSPICVEFLAEK